MGAEQGAVCEVGQSLLQNQGFGLALDPRLKLGSALAPAHIVTCLSVPFFLCPAVFPHPKHRDCEEGKFSLLFLLRCEFSGTGCSLGILVKTLLNCNGMGCHEESKAGPQKGLRGTKVLPEPLFGVICRNSSPSCPPPRECFPTHPISPVGWIYRVLPSADESRKEPGQRE